MRSSDRENYEASLKIKMKRHTQQLSGEWLKDPDLKG